MRIAIGGLSHETNTFCSALTEVNEFKDREWTHGDALVARHRGVRDYLGGMLAAARERDVEVVHGIDVTRYRVVALKSSQHFRAGFEPLAARIITADSPGLTTLDLTTFPYRRLTRPVWPLDERTRCES